MKATDTSKAKALQKLQTRCKDRLNYNGALSNKLSGTSKVSDVLAYWLENECEVKPQTRDRYRTAINKHIVPAIGNRRIKSIAPYDLDALLHSIPRGAVGNCKSVLKQSFAMAHRMGLASGNPMLSVRPIKEESKEVKALSPDEIQRLRTNLKRSGNDLLIDVVDLCFVTGLRVGEVLGLRWEDVDLDATPPVLRIRGTIVYDSELGNRRQDAPKTPKSIRTLELAPFGVETLQRRRHLQEHFEMVFPSEAGNYMWHSNFNRLFRKWRGEEFGGVGIHKIRKTFASTMYEHSGIDSTQAALGHSHREMSDSTYIARSEKRVQIAQALSEMERVLRGHEKGTEKH
ncbi:tyrosine-type recombinase/integrase [Corynebacterium gerontici]|uniref:tyrosine-type recombinase/integrase n=1 Tax=Corynebacterium gerontici TaxID=2079234 RepID=UPI0013DE7086|nr:site-specific integrase [Corynebacterium gerontici]